MTDLTRSLTGFENFHLELSRPVDAFYRLEFCLTMVVYRKRPWWFGMRIREPFDGRRWDALSMAVYRAKDEINATHDHAYVEVDKRDWEMHIHMRVIWDMRGYDEHNKMPAMLFHDVRHREPILHQAKMRIENAYRKMSSAIQIARPVRGEDYHLIRSIYIDRPLEKELRDKRNLFVG